MKTRLSHPLRASGSDKSFQFLSESSRQISKLYTSYHRSELFPTQFVMPKIRADQQFRRLLKSEETLKLVKPVLVTQKEAAESGTSTVVPMTPAANWKDAQQVDMLTVSKQTLDKACQPLQLHPKRPYFPMGTIAEIELKADYLLEGGMFVDALQWYGVVVRAYNEAYPENHNQRIKVYIKLARALRLTERLQSSKKNLEFALEMCGKCEGLNLEHLTEALLELGITKVALNDVDAGEAFEDVIRVVDEYHSHGHSHRMLRMVHRLTRRASLHMEFKFVYFSPFDNDRVFVIADDAIKRAEEFYRKRNDQESVVRVLETHSKLLDKKFFNMRDYAFRVRSMKGCWRRRAFHLTNAATPEELLLYSPTIHQPHRDWTLEHNAPLGKENEVAPGVNRVEIDDGSPTRKMKDQSQEVQNLLYRELGTMQNVARRSHWDATQ